MIELTSELVETLVNLMADVRDASDTMDDWWVTPATGGPNGDGMVPFVNRGGVTNMVPSMHKILSMIPTGQPAELMFRIFGSSSIIYAGEHEDIRAPFSMVVTRVWASLTAPDQSAGGAIGLRANLNVDGVAMLSTPLTIAPGQLLSTDSGVDAPVIANPLIAEKARLTFPVLLTGGGAKGLTYVLGGYRA